MIPCDESNYGIYKGDARQLALTLDDESVDMIFTDPVYSEIGDYAWLAELGMRVLKPNRPLLAFTSTKRVTAVMEAMATSGLTYIWTMYYTIIAKSTKLYQYHLHTWTTPALLFAKGGDFHAYDWVPDTFVTKNGPASGKHKWNKNDPVLERWVTAFTRPGDVVLDPFCGGGRIPVAAKWLSRRWLGFDKDQVAVTESRIAVSRAQVKRILPLGEQLGMFDDEEADDGQ